MKVSTGKKEYMKKIGQEKVKVFGKGKIGEVIKVKFPITGKRLGSRSIHRFITVQHAIEKIQGKGLKFNF